MINMEEILVMNISGVLLLLMLPHLKIKGEKYQNFGDKIFSAMRVISFIALIVEIFTFLIDGRPGENLRMLSIFFNSYLFLASSAVGMLWVIYVDYIIYRSPTRIGRQLVLILCPFLCILLLILGDMFGLGNIFYITQENVYVRGPLAFISYIVMFSYYFYSIVIAVQATKKRGYLLLPVYYFVFPCIVGTIVQEMKYGITTGWFAVSITFVMIQMHRQNYNAYIDVLSGLNNRRYYNYFIDKITGSSKCKTLSGIMIDINDFKKINDSFGHKVGDDAIRDIASIISAITGRTITTAFRLSGDEFVIIGENLSEQETVELIEYLNCKIKELNEKHIRPYEISLAIGYHICEIDNFNADTFFDQMDENMYKSKAKYHMQTMA